MCHYMNERNDKLYLEDFGLIYLYKLFSSDEYSAKWIGGLENNDKNWLGYTKKEQFIEWVNNGYHLNMIREYVTEDLQYLRDCVRDIKNQLGGSVMEYKKMSMI